MSEHRMPQVDELIKHQLAKIISEELEWPRDSLATVVKAKTSKDLKHCRVYVSIIPHNKSGSALDFLNKNIGRLQGALGRSIKLRNIPKISFELDFTEHEAEKIEKLLEETKQS